MVQNGAALKQGASVAGASEPPEPHPAEALPAPDAGAPEIRTPVPLTPAEEGALERLAEVCWPPKGRPD